MPFYPQMSKNITQQRGTCKTCLYMDVYMLS